MLEFRTDLTIAFLQRLHPNGLWILTAILPNKGIIETKTFNSTDIEQVEKWINSYQGKRNIYYTFNTVKEPTNNKPSKIHISELIGLHVDSDPRSNEDFTQERERILNSFLNFKPTPSIIIDSGGGYQAIFLLKEPVQLDGTIETAEEYELYNRQLELQLSGDHCHNCDRILRLPGTINVPDDKKKKKGRVAALASVVKWGEDKYDLIEFAKAPSKIQQPVKIGEEILPGGGENVQISGNIPPLYVDNLKEKNLIIPDIVKALIIHGIDPDHPDKYTSRSEALFAVVCGLLRAGADNDTVAGIIMNRENKISESVLDKTRPERYCAKQIQSAKEFIDDPKLHELNSKHAVISDMGGGKCRIISESFDYAMRRPRISFFSFPDFVNRYMNQKVQIASDADGKPVLKELGKWWLAHAQRRQYETMVFSPGREVPQAYNLWQGFACSATPGDCSLFLEHIFKNLCQGNELHNKYLLGWLARCVQQPDCPGEVAVVLRGDMGTGKSFFAKTFGSLFGRHFLAVSDPKHLVGSFNSHLRDCICLMADEAFYAGDKKHESVLKSLVTEPTITVESKGLDVVLAPNYTHIIMASNSSWVVPAGTNERRFFCLDVGEDKMQDKKYFAAIQNQMNNNGREALLHFLLNFDISDFEVRDVPKTDALQDQKLLSSSSEEMWWYEKLEEGRILKDHEYWESEVMKHALQDDYILFMQRTGMMRKASPTVLGKFLGRVCPSGVPKSYQKMAKIKSIGQFGEEYVKTKRVYFYEIPPLQVLRDHWDKCKGGPFRWESVTPRNEQIEMEDEERGAFE